jgi:H+/Cl- antiporter ClcA
VDVLKTYRSLLSIDHARAFVLAGFVARLSISMRALGSVLMVSELTGSYGLAGAVAAAALLGEAVAAPRLGRSVDRYGQQCMLVPAKPAADFSAGVCRLDDWPPTFRDPPPPPFGN